MNISVIGYYGNNFGDLLMLKSILSVRKPGAVYTVLTYGDDQALRQQGFIIDNAITVVKLDKANRWRAYKSVIASAAIIWGGGTCFMDEGGTGGIKYMALARLFGAKVIYAGIGVDNHKKLKTRAILFFATLIANALFIRDASSLQAVRNINPWASARTLKQSVDLAYALDTDGTDVTPVRVCSDDYIIVCLRDLERYCVGSSSDDYRQLLDVATTLCEQLGVGKVGILNADAEIDSGVSCYAECLLKDRGFTVFGISGSDIDTSVAYIKGARHLLTARLHPAVVAYSVGTPFSLYNYSDKNKKFTSETHTEARLIQRGAISDFVPVYKRDSTVDERVQKQRAVSTISEIYQLLN